MQYLKQLFWCMLLLVSLWGRGQKENNVWYFGTGTGLDFSSGAPQVLSNGAIDGFEGCATICDKTTGSILFYTNSDRVWNKNHGEMANGDLLPDNNSISQVVIVPRPGSNTIYYIFTTDMQASAFQPHGFRLHTVDISKKNGLGEVITKNQLIYPAPLSEKITAIRHTNGTDIWVIGHECGSNRFFSFLVTAGGVSSSPVVSQTGKVHQYNTHKSNWDAIGQMTASPDGNKIAVATFSGPDIELFNFNRTTGKIGNCITLYEGGSSSVFGNHSRLYGVAFSPDNSLLYASIGEFPCKLLQYSLRNYNQGDINASRQVIFWSHSETVYGLHPAPDGKIYTGGEFREYLGVINKPDAEGGACNYSHNGLYLNGKKSGWVLGNGILQDTLPAGDPVFIDDGEFKFVLWPNPTAGAARLQFSNPQKKQHVFILYDALGRQIEKKENITGSTVDFDTQFLANAVYFVVLLHNNEKLIATKLTVLE